MNNVEIQKQTNHYIVKQNVKQIKLLSWNLSHKFVLISPIFAPGFSYLSQTVHILNIQSQYQVFNVFTFSFNYSCIICLEFNLIGKVLRGIMKVFSRNRTAMLLKDMPVHAKVGNLYYNLFIFP